MRVLWAAAAALFKVLDGCVGSRVLSDIEGQNSIDFEMSLSVYSLANASLRAS
jgi:hypothetical protein